MGKGVTIERSHRLDGIGEYYFSRRLREIAETEAATGRQIIKLAMGSPDLPPAQTVIDTLAREAQRPDVHKYMSYQGEPILRKAFADWYKKFYGVDLDWKTEVYPLIGSKEGLMHVCMTFLNEGDKVLVPNPGYPTYSAAVKLAGVWGAVTAFFLWRWVPWMEPVADSRGLKGQFAFLRNRAPWLIILATMFGNGGIFCMYSYVSPLMIRVAGFSPEAMTLVILLAGLGMFVGNLVSGGLSDRYTPERVARFAQGIAVVALALILFLAANRWAALTLTVVCTTMLFAVSSPQQVLILENAPGGQMLGAALIQVAFNLGNALGAYCGGLPIEYGLGYEYSALPGVGFALLGFVMLTLFVRRYGRRRPRMA